MRYSGRSVYAGAVLIATLAAGAVWPALGQTASGSAGANYDAQAGIQRFYVSSPQDDIPSLNPDSLTLNRLFEGDNERIYRHPALVKLAISRDAALAAFCNSAEYGARAKGIINNAILYAGIPRAGAEGFNDFNTQRPGVAGRAALGKRAQRQRNISTPAQTPAPPLTPAARNLPILGDIQPQALTGGPAAESSTGPTLQQRIQRARQSFPKEFSTVVGLAPDGRQAMLYVFGRLPDTANTEAPVNFTVIAKQYRPVGSDAGDWSEHPNSVTLVDKQTLAPSRDGQTRYFCFQYPVPASAAAGQTDMLVSYWISPSLAYTHGVAIARGSGSAWITVPISRLERYQREYRYQLIENTEAGAEIRPGRRD